MKMKVKKILSLVLVFMLVTMMSISNSAAVADAVNTAETLSDTSVPWPTDEKIASPNVTVDAVPENMVTGFMADLDYAQADWDERLAKSLSFGDENRDIIHVAPEEIVKIDTINPGGGLVKEAGENKDAIVAANKKLLSDHGIDPESPLADTIRKVRNEVSYGSAFTGNGGDVGSGGHTLTGPVYVDGAEPGDVLEVRILDLQQITPYGFCSQRPGAGGIPDDPTLRQKGSYTKIIDIDTENDLILFDEEKGIVFPRRPFMGIIGVAPKDGYTAGYDGGYVKSTAPGEYAGNIDCNDFTIGSTIYIPVWQEGALVYTGDAHSIQGDGEVTVNAVETSMAGTFQFILHKAEDLDGYLKTLSVPRNTGAYADGALYSNPYGHPVAETKDEYIIVGLGTKDGKDIDSAMQDAILETINFLVAEKGMTWQEAFALASVNIDFEVTQVVDSTYGVHAMIDKSIFIDYDTAVAKYGGKEEVNVTPDVTVTAVPEHMITGFMADLNYVEKDWDARVAKGWSSGVRDIPHVLPGQIVKIDTINPGGGIQLSSATNAEERNKAFFEAHGIDPEGSLAAAILRVRNEVRFGDPLNNTSQVASGGHTLTGPVYVEGAEPGDVLEVRVIDLEQITPYGFCSQGRTSGGIPNDPILTINGSYTKVIDIENNMALFDENIVFPLRPFMGIIGVAPKDGYTAGYEGGFVRSTAPGEYAGNIDCNDFTIGSTIYIPVWQEGALVYTGDAHSIQGDGEVTVNAIESSISGTFQFILHKAADLGGYSATLHDSRDTGLYANDAAYSNHYGHPYAETDKEYIIVGLGAKDGKELDSAVQDAILETINFLVTEKGMTWQEAFALASVNIDYEVTQVVDSTYGAHGMIDKALFTKEASDYWHDDMAIYTLAVVGGEDRTASGPYAEGDIVSVAAGSPPTGKVFDRWTVSGGGIFADVNSATTTFTMPARAVTLTATYKSSQTGGPATSGPGGSSGVGTIGSGGSAQTSTSTTTQPSVTESGESVETGSAATTDQALSRFNDSSSVSGWARGFFEKLIPLNVISGYPDGTLKPKGNVTRAEFTKMVVQGMGLTRSESVPPAFSDVTAGLWHKEYIDIASGLGVVNGISSDRFDPDALISRQDMCAIAYRALTAKQAALPQLAMGDKFPDDLSISDYAKEAVYMLRQLNVIGGRPDGNFDPAAFATREETAKIISGIIDFQVK